MRGGDGGPAQAAEEQPRPRSPQPCVGVATTSSLARERPRPATSTRGSSGTEGAWVMRESEDARQAPSAVEVLPGGAVESRGVLFLGRLPYFANRM